MMKDQDKIKEALIHELRELHHLLKDVEASQIELSARKPLHWKPADMPRVLSRQYASRFWYWMPT